MNKHNSYHNFCIGYCVVYDNTRHFELRNIEELHDICNRKSELSYLRLKY